MMTSGRAGSRLQVVFPGAFDQVEPALVAPALRGHRPRDRMVVHERPRMVHLADVRCLSTSLSGTSQRAKLQSVLHAAEEHDAGASLQAHRPGGGRQDGWSRTPRDRSSGPSAGIGFAPQSAELLDLGLVGENGDGKRRRLDHGRIEPRGPIVAETLLARNQLRRDLQLGGRAVSGNSKPICPASATSPCGIPFNGNRRLAID